MSIKHTMLADVSNIFDSPNNGEYKLYPGGTPLADAMDSINAAATIALQKYSTFKTMEFIGKEWTHQKTSVLSPIGIKIQTVFLKRYTQDNRKDRTSGR